MSYRIDPAEPVGEEIRRIATEQIERGRDETRSPDLHEAVHQVRKRCKKIRGLLRLVRPALGEVYAAENQWYRDTARRISALRDAQSLIETCGALADRFPDETANSDFERLERLLIERRDRDAGRDAGVRDTLEWIRSRFEQGLERVPRWRLSADGIDALSGGLGKTYKRARRGMDRAYAQPSAENFHEWRKRCKYHYYHLRLLRSVWRRPMKGFVSEAHRLSGLLGDDHDLAVFRGALKDEAADLGAAGLIETADRLAARHQEELRERARTLGARLLAEKPKLAVRRLGSYWCAAVEEQDT